MDEALVGGPAVWEATFFPVTAPPQPGSHVWAPKAAPPVLCWLPWAVRGGVAEHGL